MLRSSAQLRVFSILIVVMTLAGCTADQQSGSAAPDVIKIGVIPDQSQDRLLAQYTPLLNYLRDSTSLEYELVLAGNYAELLEDFDAGRVHLANFGGLTFVQAEQRSGARPLVMRDTDLNFSSCFFVKESTPGQTLEEFKGESLTFGPRLSTSGHLMPRRFLTKSRIDPESFFSSISYSSRHDESIRLVREGKVTVGAANCVIFRSVTEKASADDSGVRLIATTPGYTNYVWAAQGWLSSDTENTLRDAFLALDISNEQHAPVLKSVVARGYFPAGRSDFDDIRLTARQIGLLDAAKAK